MKLAQQSAKAMRPIAVLDFTCDHCGKKMDAVILASSGTERRVVKSYHDKCWTEHILPQQRPLVRLGEN